MIEIDDSGTGDLVGAAFLGFYRKETDQMIFKTIPVELFFEEPFKNKEPLKKAVELVKETFTEMNVSKDELIKICRGNIFDKVRSYFIETNQNYEDTKIEGKLQDAVESRYVNHLRELGVKSRNLTIESGKKRFFILFGWVCRDFYRREKYVKSGFKRWRNIWRDRAIEKYEDYQKDKKERLRK